MRWTVPFILTGLVGFGTTAAEVFDFGNLDQYNSKEQNPPSLSGNTVWLSGTDQEGGFDVGISPDIKAKIQGVLEGCGNLDDKCYQETREILRSADLAVDKSIEGRGFGQMISKTVKGGWAFFADFATTLYMSWFQKSKDLEGAEAFMFIPAAKASEAAKLETATSVVVSAGGTVVATITPKPDPTSLKGSHAPSVTAATVAHDGLAKGDLSVSLDQDLASRIQEIITRSMDCEDGTEFDQEHPSKRRASSRLGRAICAYEGVIVNMGAALSDLMQTDLGVLDLVTPATPPDRAAAAAYAERVLEEYAPLINLPLDRARALAAYLFALIISVVVDGGTLGTNNKIPAELIQTRVPTNKPTRTTASSTSSSSSSGCPDPTKTALWCGWESDNNCTVVLPKATDDKPRCKKDGKYPNCPCNPPTYSMEQNTVNGEQKAINMFVELFKNNPVPEPVIKCRNHPLSAPKKDADANGATSVESAIDFWCQDNHGKKVSGDPGKDSVYWWWGVTALGVPDRSSFWLRATLNQAGSATIDVDDCKKALHKGLDDCDQGNTVTHGHTASLGNMDYDVDLSGVTDHVDSPPWDEKPAFPAPEFTPGKNMGGAANEPICDAQKFDHPIADPDFDAALDAFCQDGNEIKGFGKNWENMFDYPPAGQPQWWPTKGGYNSHLTVGEETINNGAPEPYDNMDWCKGFDWKSGRDDCKYALRKMRQTCSPDGQFGGGSYIYRCVNYKMWIVNLRS